MIEMTAGAPHGAVGARSAVRNFLRRARLAQIRPWLLREIFCDGLHIVSFHRRDDRLHNVALAVAALEIAQLYIDVARLLAPNGRESLVNWLAVRAMAAGAYLCLFFNALRIPRRCP